MSEQDNELARVLTAHPQPDLRRRRSPLPPVRDSGGPLRQWMRDLVISVVASLLIITCLYQPVRVEGTSMQPRLHDQDRLFINKFVYHFEGISRGDVVVFHYPRDPAKRLHQARDRAARRRPPHRGWAGLRKRRHA